MRLIGVGLLLLARASHLEELLIARVWSGINACYGRLRLRYLAERTAATRT